MKKWLKRIILIIIVIPLLIFILGYFLKPISFYELKLVLASQVQWFGYEEIGNNMINSSLAYLGTTRGTMYHLISVQNTKNGNYDEAIKFLEKAIELDPKAGEGYYGWVLLYYYRDYEKALKHLLNYDSYTPNFTDNVGDDNILYAIGLCYKGLGQYDKALEYFTMAIADELAHYEEEWIPHHMFFQKGRVLHLMGKREDAIFFYDKTLKIWERSSEALYYKGLAFIELNEPKKGCENLRKSLDLLKSGYKSTDAYVALFDEVYKGEVLDAIQKQCDSE